MNAVELILILSVLPMLLVCWQCDKIKNGGKAKTIMNKKLKIRGIK